MPIAVKPFPDSDSYLVISSEAIATGGLHSGRNLLNVPISTEELSGFNFLPHRTQIILIVEKYTKIYIRERRITSQSNLKRRKSLCCTVGPGGNTEWVY